MSHSPLRIAEVNLDAVAANTSRITEIANVDDVMIVVKANGYGHGMIPVAKAALAGGATWLGVADISEALMLRQAGIAAPVLAWLHAPDETFDEAVTNQIALGVASVAQLEAIVAAGERHSVVPSIHVKIDTGLSRNGAEYRTWQDFFATATAFQTTGKVLVDGLMSHLSNTSASEDLRQLERFNEGISLATQAGLTPRFIHLAASLAALTLPETRFNMVRSGIAAYGIAPTEEHRPEEFGLVPAMTLTSKVVSTKSVPLGSGVSYGYTYRTDADNHLALVPLGYGDGLNRNASNAGPVVINGERYKVSGRIAMDQFVVDLGKADVSVGDEVILFGNPAHGAPSVHEWAAAADSIAYEIVTRLVGTRLEYVYTGAIQ